MFSDQGDIEHDCFFVTIFGSEEDCDLCGNREEVGSSDHL